jgi:spore photoproduct lyase
MLEKLSLGLSESAKKAIEFELITHRFTARAKKNILAVFPKTKVPLDEEERVFKFGQFGYGKYVYPPDKMRELKEFFELKIRECFPDAKLLYFV